MSTQPIQVREFKQYEYHDPFAFLRSIRRFEPVVAASSLDFKTRTLHTRKLKKANEQRQAALYAVGMAQRLPAYKFDFCLVENSDYDAVVRWTNNDEHNFSPIQLKEFVPKKLNSSATLEEIIHGLKKYKNKNPDHERSNLTVAVFSNREFRLELSALPKLDLQIGGLFLFGAAERSQSRWVMIGDILSEPSLTEFNYPT